MHFTPLHNQQHLAICFRDLGHVAVITMAPPGTKWIMKAVGLGEAHEEIEKRKREMKELDQRRRMGGNSGTCCIVFRMLAAADCIVSFIL